MMTTAAVGRLLPPSPESLTRLYMLSIVVAPLAALLILSVLIVRENSHRADAIETQRLLVKSSAIAGRLVTELQRERGTSSGFLSSMGAEFGPALVERRQRTDAAVADALAVFDEIGLAQTADGRDQESPATTSTLSGAIATARESITDLGVVRARVDLADAGRAEMMRFYTGIITALLTITDITAISGTATESDRLAVVIALLENAIEMAGQERAAGASYFGAGAFDLARQFEMARLDAGKELLLSRFRRLAAPETLADLDAIQAGSNNRTLDELRQRAALGQVEGVTGVEWFEAATRVIDDLSGLSADLRQRQMTVIDTFRADLDARSRNTVLIVATALLLSLLLVLWQSRSLVAPMRDFATNLQRLGDGETEIEVHGLARRDLIGALARSVARIADLQSQRLRDLLHLAPVPTSIESVDGTFRHHNSAMYTFLALDTDEKDTSGERSLSEFVEGDRAVFEDLADLPIGESGAARTHEMTFRRTDCLIRTGLVTRSRVPGTASVPDVIVTQILDITEARKLELTKTNFVSSVSHELRTPLTSVRGAVTMIRAKRKEDGDPMERRLLEIAENNCERLLTLINDLLDMDRLAQGGIALQMDRYEVGGLCRDAVTDLGPYAAGLGLHVEYKEARSRLFTRTDAARFNQVLTNLVSNALKFSPAGTVVHVAADCRDDQIRVTVTDSGPGIPAEFAPHLFDRFRQGDGAHTRTYGGSGIGLNICKGLVDLLGGEIGFENRSEGGAQFWFTVPMMGATATFSNGSAEAVEWDTALPVILHIEDDAAFADLFRMVAEPFAHVLFAQSFAEAEEMLSHEPVDLVLVDWELPDGSGVDLLGHPAISGSAVPVVSLSSSSKTVRLARTQRDLVKSEGSIEEIGAAVRQVLEEHIATRDTSKWRPRPKTRFGLTG